MLRLTGILCALSLFIMAFSYPDNPPPAHTGGFGEPTCHQCHFENDLNAPGGVLSVRGLEKGYVSGETRSIEVRLSRPDMQLAGFQLTIRFANGQQAGTLSPVNERVTVDITDQVEYIRHTKEGTRPLTSDSTGWKLKWVPPASTEPVMVHLAANAANGDASEFGDSIYLLEQKVESSLNLEP